MINAPNPLLDAALAYAARGWPVLPLDGKRPLVQGGCHAATTDARVIPLWWSRWPHANVGIATGERSGLLVIDIDQRVDKGCFGEETLEDLVRELGSLPDTAMSLTGGGGRHLLFNHPGVTTRGKLDEGVEIKGAGGYIVAPPSLHDSGRKYAWELSSDPLDPDCPANIADLPPTWIERVRRSHGVEDLGTEGLTRVHQSLRTERHDSRPPDWRKKVDALISETLPRVSGERNACLGRLIGGLKIDMGLKLTPIELRRIVDEWYRRAAERVAMNASADDNFAEAETWWKHRDFGARSPAAAAFASAEAGRPWTAWEDLWPDETMRHLVAGLVALQAMLGPDEPFCGSSYLLGTLTDAEQRATYGRLERLVEIGFLELVARGTKGVRGRANQYRVISTPEQIMQRLVESANGAQ
ncbi:bifunctional DNA primase/polymerase [Nodularia spumigena]|uniref:bifunctional DNA primase/polymerase n=1 Tax=Nodularia spumigena TaxID=70799 RepID=UPI002B1EDFEC|nr:bifunctional DNA primase/polymerase [Nodularia spumigena]MEA5615133.1 bifunctional DNA primase/polymerase [Nodularia spumigena UHCC 0040]